MLIIKKVIKKYCNLEIILSFVILAWLSVCLLVHTHSLMGAGDMPLHLPQLKEAQLALNHHQLAFYGFNQFHGSAVMTLYPWFSLWPAVLLADFVKNPILVVDLFFAFDEFLTLLICYYGSLWFSRSRRISYLFAVFYGMSTLYLEYGFSDLDWGELASMTFLPLIIFGAIDLVQHHHWLELSAGMSLLIGSHVLNIFIVTGFLVIFFALNLRQLRLKFWLNLAKAIALTGVATLCIWFPAVRIMYLNPSITTPPPYHLYGTPFREVISSALKGTWSYGPSLMALIGLVLGGIGFLSLGRYAKQWYLMSLLVVIICSAWFPWQYVKVVLTRMQFTWRLYLIPELWLSYVLAAVMVHYLKRRRVIEDLLMAVLMILTIGIQLESQQQLIALNGHSIPINFIFYRHHMAFYQAYGQRTKRRAKHPRQFYSIRFLKHRGGGIKTPMSYQLRDAHDYRAFLDDNVCTDASGSYVPLTALQHYYGPISNNYIFNTDGNQAMITKLYHTGYDRFRFDNQHQISRFFLPLVCFNGETLRIEIDHRPVSYVMKHGTVLLNDKVPSGHHRLTINLDQRSQPYDWCYLALVVGLLVYIVEIAKIIVKKVRWLG